MTQEEKIELKAAVGRLMYANDKDIRDYNALIEFIDAPQYSLTREQVEKLRGEVNKVDKFLYACSRCGSFIDRGDDFCCRCGVPLTDEAVDILMQKLEALKDD